MIIAESGTAWAHLNPEDRIQSVLAHAQMAASVGADVFKVQMFVPDEPLFCSLPGDDERWNWWRKTFISFDHWRQIKWRCEAQFGIEFMASAFQHTAVHWLNNLDVGHYKVASRAVDTFPYKECPGPFIISTGMGMPNPVLSHSMLLQCASKYPTPLSEARWESRNVFIGLSDHSGTIWPSIDALSRGAEIVEIHFVVGEDTGPDQKVSLTVEQLGLICQARDAFREMRP